MSYESKADYNATTPRKKVNRVGMILRLVFLAFALFLIGFYLKEATFTQQGATNSTSGVVTQTSAYHNDDGSTSCALHVAFTTQQGQSIEFTPGGLGDSGQYCSYKVSQSVGITYNANNPHSAQLSQQNNAWLTNLPVLGIGLVVIIGILLSFKQYKVVNPVPLTEESEEEEEVEEA